MMPLPSKLIIKQIESPTLRLLRDDELLPLRLRLALARARVLAATLLLDARCVEHRPLELTSFVYRLRKVTRPVRGEPQASVDETEARDIGRKKSLDTIP